MLCKGEKNSTSEGLKVLLRSSKDHSKNALIVLIFWLLENNFITGFAVIRYLEYKSADQYVIE